MILTIPAARVPEFLNQARQTKQNLIITSVPSLEGDVNGHVEDLEETRPDVIIFETGDKAKAREIAEAYKNNSNASVLALILK